MNDLPNWLVHICLTGLLFSCQVSQYIPENEKLYTGAEIDLHYPSGEKRNEELASALNDALYPEPNSTFLGMKIGLWAHYKVAAEKDGIISRFIDKKFGEGPVYLSSFEITETEKILVNRAINRGYFYTRIQSNLKEDEKTAKLEYQLQLSQPYHLRNYQYPRDSTRLDSMIRQSLLETELDSGMAYNLDAFKSERQRIDQFLKDRGYYYFNSDYLIFTADTNHYDDEGFDLYLELKKSVPLNKQLPYELSEVYVYSNHRSRPDSTQPMDTTLFRDISFIRSEPLVDPKHLRNYILINPGDRYSKTIAEATTRHLSSMGIYQHANLQFQSGDSASDASRGSLRARLYLVPAEKYNLRAGTQAVTKSTGFAGPGFNITVQNRNLFGGAEVLQVEASMGYEFQISRGSSQGLNNFELRLDNTLKLPRLITPFFQPQTTGLYDIPETRIKLNYHLQQRALYYTVNSMLGSFGYRWLSSQTVEWEFTPFSLNYMTVYNKTEEFAEILDGNTFLARSFDDQFIPAISGQYRFSELGLAEKSHRKYLSIKLEEAGFLTRQVASSGLLFGQPFAEYIKSDIDFRYKIVLDEEREWVSRLFAGVGLPYGNDRSLPFIKQYFAGGPNSLRGFQVRSVGPGSFTPSAVNAQTFFDQAGDIRLEFNLEYRFPMISYLKGAVFMDAGNIWLMNNNPSLPGGQFSSDWPGEIAMALGYGFRLDLSVLVIRMDIAHPLRYPSDRVKNGWEDNLALNKVVWNFAIGYPF